MIRTARSNCGRFIRFSHACAEDESDTPKNNVNVSSKVLMGKRYLKTAKVTSICGLGGFGLAVTVRTFLLLWFRFRYLSWGKAFLLLHLRHCRFLCLFHLGRCVLQPLVKSLLNIVNTGAEHRRSPLHVSQCRFEEIGRLLQVVQPRFQIAGTVLLDFLGNTLIYNIGIR